MCVAANFSLTNREGEDVERGSGARERVCSVGSEEHMVARDWLETGQPV